MKTIRFTIRFLALLSLALIPLTLSSQERVRNNDFQPEVVQEGKDGGWVPTPQELVEKMLDIAKVTPKDFLIDLGSGDGRTVITAAKRGVRAIGIEYNPNMVELSRKNAEQAGVSNMAQFLQTDLFEYDFSQATVITMFLLPDINMRLRPKILDMKPGTRIVSNTFTMQDWQSDDRAELEDEYSSWNTCYLWIVPAKVEGKWTLGGGDEIDLSQEFQMISGTITLNKKNVPISEGRLRGTEISFKAGNDSYKGVVSGNRMEGTAVTEKGTVKWNATR
jgi:precorrin-6B methylase 2